MPLFLRSYLNQILSNQRTIIRNQHNQEKIMAMNKQDLDTAISKVQDSVQKIGSDLKTTLADIQAKVDAQTGGTPIDLTDEVTALTGISDALTSLDTAITSADPGTAPATQPAP